MVHIRSCILSVVACAICLGMSAAQTQKFYHDDPIQADPKPIAVKEAGKLKIFDLHDYVYQTGRQNARISRPAMGINTLGEAPDSAWFTNRHGRNRMTREELKRGPGNEHPPRPPYVIVGAKTEGITPGFKMKDANGRVYFVKPDPVTNPELNTGADVIGSKFFYAIGYNTPENYIVRIRKSELTVGKEAKISLPNRISREMVGHDIQGILEKAARSPDGSYRVIASLAIPGKDLGPFRYEGTRSDDPNDLVPHEDRRDLRGLFVFCAWLNHTDAKAANSLNALIREDGIEYIRHYLIDFGSAFGSDGDAPKDARFGNAYQIPVAGAVMKSLLGLGLYSPGWERAVYPKLSAVGRIESDAFELDRWKPNYPNPAFLRRRPDDEYWAAKIVMAFTNDDIRAVVETGQYSDPLFVDYLVSTLAQRRDKIGRACFANVLSLDNFGTRDGDLFFEDLSVTYNFRALLPYQISWSGFDNNTGAFTPLPGETSFRLPRLIDSAADGEYFAARIHAEPDERKTVTVFLRKKGAAREIVGVEREW
ncbi:MAG: hypothetical protein JXA73_06105 [Acidobacteria bacterium]|nr:hypothetical protein [Acidobacteriota bacterium]